MCQAHIHKLIDNLPSTVEAVRAVLQGYVVTVSNENLKKMAELIAEYTEIKK